MGKNNKKGPKANVFKVAGAKSLKKTKAKAVNLGLKNADTQTTAFLPSKYHRKPGVRRPYIDYTKTQLEECLAAIRSKELTQRDASDYYKIPRSTIKFKLANKSNKNPGRQPTFTEEEEELFVEHISTLSALGFPFTNLDIKMVIKAYLDSQNRIVPLFRNNIPGQDWIKSFIERHEYLYLYRVNVRAHASEASITGFIENIADALVNINPENIYVYDEISFSDDPLRSDVIGRRETKYPEVKINASRPCFSVMLCANAVGSTVPPFVTYKSDFLCSNWTENGPDGASYNATKHGWIDVVTFENWFVDHLLPILRHKEGLKVLIGDNHATHISREVLAECNKNNIKFICLPPNAISVLHPLNNVYCQPLQKIWRKLLLDWKRIKIETKVSKTLKAEFPYLLKTALSCLESSSQNIVNEFQETGLYPVSLHRPLARLNSYRTLNAHKRKRNMQATKSMFASDLDDIINYWQIEHDSEIKQEFEDTSSLNSYTDVEASNASSNDICLLIVDGDEVLQIPIEDYHAPTNVLRVCVGDHVIISRAASNYPGKVVDTYDGGAFVQCMKREHFFWRWPKFRNTKFYSWDKIICKIDAPKLVKRECYAVPELV